MRFHQALEIVPLSIWFCSGAAFADPTPSDTAAVEKNIQAIIADTEAIAADPIIIEAVKAHNLLPQNTMTQEAWIKLPVRDPRIVALRTNAVAIRIKSQIKPYVSEAFLSGKTETKVAFLNKTTNWTHAGMPKHDEPLAGRIWRGKLEIDASSGILQLQISVPVRDGTTVIGSLVIGVAVARL